jgi:hypothetical protein
LNRAPDIRPYRGKFPQIAVWAYIDPAAVIIGDVGDQHSIAGTRSGTWGTKIFVRAKWRVA